MTLRQWLWLSLLACFWGSAFILMELALPVFAPLTIVASRMCVAAILLNFVVWQQRKRHLLTQETFEKDISLLTWIKCGGLSLLSNLLPFGLIVWGQQYISASLASILVTASPLFTVLLAVVWKKERMTLSRSLGVLLGFAGVIVLIGPTVLSGFSLTGAGELAVLAAALSYALTGFVGQRFSHLPPLLVSRMTVTMGALMMVPIALIYTAVFSTSVLYSVAAFSASASSPSILSAATGMVWPWPTVKAILALVGLGVFSTGLAYIIYYRLLSEAGVVNTSLVSFLVPLTAVVLSVLFLRERVDGMDLLGMAFILCGLAVLDGRLAHKLKTFS
ncbi:MAG: DMT family transporter [Phormidesmis sp.]